MNYAKYSKQLFDEKGLDSEQARQLADELETDVAKEIHKAVSAAFLKVINELNTQGHKLSPYGEIKVGDIPFRDESDDGVCHLRLACDVVISSGYADVTPPNPKEKC
jgi:hypothetical protein